MSEARRRAALSKLQAEQVQRAAAAKAELARRQAEAQAEQARQQAEQSRRQAEQAEAQAALQAQAAMDEAEYRQLELELLEQEERGSQHPRSSAAPSVARLPVVATEPPAPVDVSRQTDESVTRTRQWLAQSQLHVPPVDTAPVGTLPPPAMRLQRPSSDDTRAVPHLPRITLEKFGGSAIEWPRWIALFKALVHDRADLTDVERLTYLQTHLTGPAKESVRGMLCDASLYSTALGELEREFGDPSRVIHATMKRLITARPVKDGDLSALTELSRELHTAVSVLQCLHYEHDLAAATNVTTVTGKLPASLAWRWGEHMVENGITRPTLVDLDEWLRRHVSAGRLALNVTTKQLPKVDANDAEYRPRRVFTTASARPTPAAVKRERTAAIKSSADGHSDWCTMCQQTHELQHCDEFLALTVSEKAEFVGRNGLCFNCLGRDHISATCPSDARCDAEHCGRRHHTLLHNGGRVFPLRDSDDGTPSSAKHVGTASAEPRSDVLLQVVPITVNGPAGSRTTNALFDLGSQVTLITDDLCDRLGISGPTDKLVLSTLSGTQTTTSRRVSFAVEAVGGDGRAHRIRNAQTTPTLNVSVKAMVCTVAKEKWPHLADLDLPSATHGPVEVLLGTDVIELIVPREVIEGPTGTPCAVRTLLGWTVTGRASERSVLDGEHVVNHVRVSDKTSGAVADLHTQESSETTQWCHAAEPPGPADIFSRGGPGTDLAPGGPWIRGPAARSGPAALSDDETRVTACVTERAEPVVNGSDFSSCLMDSGGLLRVGGRRWKRKNTQPQDRPWRRRRRECLPAQADRTLHVDHGHDRGQDFFMKEEEGLIMETCQCGLEINSGSNKCLTVN
ncbi:hypothetical protein FJT64_026600 [Amphibalanus amphitrite]|uniref:Uncharacterized protein n=1 Tax=Amphibalanus amphitrite TaxID=1232801 RepID=A0A6A4W1B2_AMPAM|nr:hypothetical protein FJT64_026600 [Amphibalanus amphitrite]